MARVSNLCPKIARTFIPEMKQKNKEINMPNLFGNVNKYSVGYVEIAMAWIPCC